MKNAAQEMDYKMPVLSGQIRHVLGIVGGMAASAGYISDSDVGVVVGLAMSVLAMLWSWGQKKWGWQI